MPEPYSQFDPPPQVETDYSGLPSLAVQSFADEADINFIMARYRKTGFLENAQGRVDRASFFGVFDFANAIYDFADMNQRLVESREQFEKLPSDLRARFFNDPNLLIAFLQNPANAVEAVELGLLNEVDAPLPS